ncbi:MAG: ABC transporter substrate-binding protein [Verrucomicrobia bacterium]|nr:ABC transporter substrate-binding protein [Cytophagales bacterium]
MFIFACNKQNSQETIRSGTGKGGRAYGGVFRVSEAEYVKSLFPPSIIDGFSYRVASQIYEGLFKFDTHTLKVIKSLAADYTVDSSQTIYTIKIKPEVYFHDDACFPNSKGKEMTAEDIKYCFTQLCKESADNQGFILVKNIVKGANAYYQASKNGKKPSFEVEGIKVIDKYTIQFILDKPSSVFLYNLARPGTFIYPREAYEKYGQDMNFKSVGTGAFYLANTDAEIAMILKRHERYHGTDSLGNALPFLDAINIRFIKDKKNELFEFKQGKLDMLYRIPTEFILDLDSAMAQSPRKGEYMNYELQRSPEMLTQFLVFQTKEGVFRDVQVRKAINFAIDKEKILNFVLNGEGDAAGNHGITPDIFEDYKIDNIRGYAFSVDSAQIYMKKAGFGKGKKFPKITFTLNAEGGRNTLVAVEIQKQLKDVLGIDVELVTAPLAQVVDDAQKGRFELLRVAWLADYPNPENFLHQFYGKSVPNDPKQISFPNISRYKNPVFDDFYEKALNAKSQAEANNYFAKAENQLMKDAPVAIIWYDESYRLLFKYVKNFPNNAMQYRDLSQVWLEKSK